MNIPFFGLQSTIIKMNESFNSTDENDQKTKHCLFNEIQQIDTNHWQPQTFSINEDDSKHQSLNGEEQIDRSFNDDLPVQSNISENHETQDKVFQQPLITIEESQPPKIILSKDPPESMSSNSSMPSQVTITLHEESISSKFFEEIDTVDSSGFSSSLKSFLSLNDKNYRPHVKCLKFLFDKLKQYSKRSLDNLKNYITFLEVKIKQEIESLKSLDALEAVDQGPGTDDFDFDQKVILTEIKESSIRRREARKVFCSAIKEEYEHLVYWWRKIKERRQSRERHIQEQIILVLDRIELQMEDMILCRLQSERVKMEGKFISEKIRCKNPYLTKDKYLEIKYMMQRQKSYLKLITDFSGKVITYMVSMFSKEEVQIAKSIKEAMLNYAASYMDCYDHHNQVLNMKVDSLEENECEANVKAELLQSMLTMVPVELYNICERKKEIRQGQNLEAVLQDFSDCLQNTIFLETIEMNNDFILFRNQAIWKTSSSLLDKDESSIMSESKSMSNFESKQALASSRPTLEVPDSVPRKELRVVVVLTSNYYLHLENEEKVATLKLGEVKLSKRGRQIIISHKDKGLGGYFGWKRELGSLQFQTTGEVQQFAHKLSRALSKIS